jgi:hypothetical protein
MPQITKQVTVTVDLTPLEVAQIFCDMDSHSQARFFNAIAEIVADTWKNPLEFQLADITGTGILTKDGANVMRLIGEYSKENDNPAKATTQQP